jgi:hypothetical protein
MRFSIRDLLWLTVVVVVGWGVDHLSHRHCQNWRISAMDLAAVTRILADLTNPNS